MNVLFISTYKYSLETWSKSSTLDREMQFFNFMSKTYGVDFTFLTYGTKIDKNYVENNDFLVFPMFNEKIPQSNFKTIFMTFRYIISNKSKFKEIDLIFHNQLNGMWLGILAKLLLNKPLIFRSGYDTYRFSKYENKSFIKKIFFNLLTNFSFIFADLYTVSSKSDYEYSKSYFFQPKKIELRRNWISQVENSKNKIKQKDIISVGRLEKQKNYVKFLNDFSSKNFSIDIYGSGANYEILINQIKKQNLNIELKGTVTNSQLKNLYSNYRFFVSTSLFEGNPKTVLEAMSSGCIPVLSNIDNHRELVDHNENGFLVELDKNFHDFLLNINKDESALEDLSLNAQRKVQELNSLEVIAKKIYGDFISLIK